MGKTAELGKVVKAQLNTVPGGTYHKKAPADAAYPYKTFSVRGINFTDARSDYDLCVDIWDRGDDPKSAEEIADLLEDLLADANLPQETILPTFFREGRHPVDDPDKELQHIQLHFLVQLYKIEKEE